MTEALATIGHNNPPSDIEIFGEKMSQKYPGIFERAEEVILAAERAPKEVNDDTTSGKVGDFCKQIQAAIKNLEAARKAEKEEYIAAGKRVDGFFKVKWIDRLELLKTNLASLNAMYLKRKEDEERRKKEEEAERLRQEEAEKLRRAQEAEAEARRKQEEAEREAKRVAEEAARKQREIEEESARKQAALQKEIDELRAKQAEEDRIRLDNEEKERIKSLEAQQKEVRAETREALKEVREETKAAEAEVKEMVKDAKADMRESKTLLDDAARTGKTAERVEKLAGASAADLARTRGEQGSLSTIETRWVGTVTNRDTLDILALRQHFKDEDLQIALNSWVKANPGKQLVGAFIREETKAVIR